MIIDPFIGTINERRVALVRQILAQGFRVVASSACGHLISDLLRASITFGTTPKYIIDAVDDDEELMLLAQGVGGQFTQRGRITHFSHNHDGAVGYCASTDTVAIAEGHHPIDLITTGKPLDGWDLT
jgi:kynureninase